MVDHEIILMHVISSKGIEVKKVKIDIVRGLPPPIIVREVFSFLGHLGFYRKLIMDFSKISRPLCTLLQKYVPYIFDDKCNEAFEKLKELITALII